MTTFVTFFIKRWKAKINNAMKVLSTLFLFVLLATCVQAQSPSFNVKGADSAKVRMSRMKIDVKIVGNIAYTTVEMYFSNRSTREMEGELIFPLPEGISVSHYAIDINGKMRQAVPINKMKGKQVFEAIQNRRVDPGLLEKVEGNNFRTRVYPLPVNGERIVQIGYEEELKFKDNLHLNYQLLSRFPQKLDDFTVNIEVLGTTEPPQVEGTKDVSFTLWQQSYKTSIAKKDYLPNEKFEVLIPIREQIPSVYSQSVEGNHYFYSQLFLDPKVLQKKTPKTIALVYDVSLSCRTRDFNKESALLKHYLSSLKDVTVSVFFVHYTFKKQQDFVIKNGNADALISLLQSAVYDGGTRYTEINLPASFDEYLFFTDGLSSLSHQEFNLPNKPIYCITSSVSADYSFLNLLSMNSSASSINLNVVSVDEGLQMLTSQSLRFLGVKKNLFVTELYPAVGTPVGKSFSIAGLSLRPKHEITLLFGQGNEVQLEKTITLNIPQDSHPDVNVYKLWAQKKIAYLDMNYNKNQTEIEILGSKAGIVTRNTSLIVLETVQDYIRYQIVPPAELRAEFDRISKEQQNNAAARKQSNITNLDRYFKVLNAWWKKDIQYSKPEAVKPSKKESLPITPRQPSTQPTGRTITVRGTVIDEQNQSIAGATIRQEGTTNGVISDMDGKFSITLPDSCYLEIAYIGYNTQRLLPQPEMNIRLEEDGQALEEVVMVSDFSSTKEDMDIAVEDDELILILPLPQHEEMVIEESVLFMRVEGEPSENASVREESISKVSASVSQQTTGRLPQASVVATTTNPYTAVDIIKKQPKEKQYDAYLQIREEVVNNPTFYIEAARLFYDNGNKEKALLVLSSIADLGFESHQLYKTLTYIFREWGAVADALYTAQQVAKWRNFEPQSFRDLALTLEDNGKYQEAFDALIQTLEIEYLGEMERFYTGLEDVVLMDINRMITEHLAINTKKLEKKYLEKMPVDLRVVMNWNMQNTDIDLHVIDPTDEECYYSHTETRAGGRFGKDFTQGYGPEQYLLRNKIAGKYTVKSDFYGENAFTENGPASVFIEVYYKDKNGKVKRQLKTILSSKNRERNATMLELEL